MSNNDQYDELYKKKQIMQKNRVWGERVFFLTRIFNNQDCVYM